VLNHTLSSCDDWVEFRLDEPAPAKPVSTEFSHNQQNLLARDASASWKNSIIENAVKIQSESVAFQTQLVVSLPRSTNPVWWLSRLRAVKCQLTDNSKRAKTRFYLICKVSTVGSFCCGARERSIAFRLTPPRYWELCGPSLERTKENFKCNCSRCEAQLSTAALWARSLNWVNFDSA